jgi:hypothetical protein
VRSGEGWRRGGEGEVEKEGWRMWRRGGEEQGSGGGEGCGEEGGGVKGVEKGVECGEGGRREWRRGETGKLGVMLMITVRVT